MMNATYNSPSTITPSLYTVLNLIQKLLPSITVPQIIFSADHKRIITQTTTRMSCIASIGIKKRPDIDRSYSHIKSIWNRFMSSIYKHRVGPLRCLITHPGAYLNFIVLIHIKTGQHCSISSVQIRRRPSRNYTPQWICFSISRRQFDRRRKSKRRRKHDILHFSIRQIKMPVITLSITYNPRNQGPSLIVS